jgi:DNA-binding MarR family transcriptional regulator
MRKRKMNQNKIKILKAAKNLTAIKELQGKTELKMGNLCKHIKGLEEQGFIIDMGMDGKSRLIVTNTTKVVKYMSSEIKELERHIKDFQEAK